MRKIYTLLVAIALSATAMAQPFTSLWKKKVGDFAWFANNNDNTSLDYNPSTDRLYVVKRNDKVVIINPATGAELGQLNTTGVGTETFKYNKIRVTSDGVIYAISLATAAGQCKIYRWADQNAAPTLAADFAVTERTGDAFGLAGTGNSTVLYASGAALTNGAANIYILNTVNGTNFFVESKVNIPQTGNVWTGRTVEPAGVGVNSDIWIKGGGTVARKISVSAKDANNIRTATVVSTIADGVGNGEASSGYGGMRLLTAGTNKFLGFGGGNNSNAGVRMKLININSEAAPTTYGLDSLYDPTNYVSNANGTGDVAFKNNGDNTYTVFFLSTNNGFAATQSTSSILPVELSRFAATLKNKSAIVSWSTVSEANNAGFEVEKSINGRDFSAIGFVKTKSNGNSAQQLNYEFEDSRLSTKSYYRLKQIDKDGRSTYSAIAVVSLPLTKSFTVSAVNNPVKDNINLLVSSAAQNVLQVQVTNAAGAVVFNQQYRVSAGEVNLQVPAANLTTGVYYLSVKDQQTQQVLRIVK